MGVQSLKRIVKEEEMKEVERQIRGIENELLSLPKDDEMAEIPIYHFEGVGGKNPTTIINDVRHKLTDANLQIKMESIGTDVCPRFLCILLAHGVKHRGFGPTKQAAKQEAFAIFIMRNVNEGKRRKLVTEMCELTDKLDDELDEVSYSAEVSRKRPREEEELDLNKDLENYFTKQKSQIDNFWDDMTRIKRNIELNRARALAEEERKQTQEREKQLIRKKEEQTQRRKLEQRRKDDLMEIERSNSMIEGVIGEIDFGSLAPDVKDSIHYLTKKGFSIIRSRQSYSVRSKLLMKGYDDRDEPKTGSYNPYGNECMNPTWFDYSVSAIVEEFPGYIVESRNYVAGSPHPLVSQNTAVGSEYQVSLDLEVDMTERDHVFVGVLEHSYSPDLIGLTIDLSGNLVDNPLNAYYLIVKSFCNAGRLTYRWDTGGAGSNFSIVVICPSRLFMTTTVRYRKNGEAMIRDYYGGEGTNQPSSMMADVPEEDVPAVELHGVYNEYGNEQTYYDPTPGIGFLSQEEVMKWNSKGFNKNSPVRIIDVTMLGFYGWEAQSKKSSPERVTVLAKEEVGKGKEGGKEQERTGKSKEKEQAPEEAKKDRKQRRQEWMEKNETDVNRLSKFYKTLTDLVVSYINGKIDYKQFCDIARIMGTHLFTKIEWEKDWLRLGAGYIGIFLPDDELVYALSLARKDPCLAGAFGLKEILEEVGPEVDEMLEKQEGSGQQKGGKKFKEDKGKEKEEEVVTSVAKEELEEITRQKPKQTILGVELEDFDLKLEDAGVEIRQKAAHVEENVDDGVSFFSDKELAEMNERFMMQAATQYKEEEKHSGNQTGTKPFAEGSFNPYGNGQTFTPGNIDETMSSIDYDDKYPAVTWEDAEKSLSDHMVLRTPTIDEVDDELARLMAEREEKIRNDIKAKGLEDQKERDRLAEVEEVVEDERQREADIERIVSESLPESEWWPGWGWNMVLGNHIGPGRYGDKPAVNIYDKTAKVHDRLFDGTNYADALKKTEDLFGNNMLVQALRLFEPVQGLVYGKDVDRRTDLKRFEGSFNPYGNGQTARQIFGSISRSAIVAAIKSRYDILYKDSSTDYIGTDGFFSWIKDFKVERKRNDNTSQDIGLEHLWCSYGADEYMLLNAAHNGYMASAVVANKGGVRLGQSNIYTQKLVKSIVFEENVKDVMSEIAAWSKWLTQNNNIYASNIFAKFMQQTPRNTSPMTAWCMRDALYRRSSGAARGTWTNIQGSQMQLITTIPVGTNNFYQVNGGIGNRITFPLNADKVGGIITAMLTSPSVIAEKWANVNSFVPPIGYPARMGFNDDEFILIPYNRNLFYMQGGNVVDTVKRDAFMWYVVCFLEYPIFSRVFTQIVQGGIPAVPGINCIGAPFAQKVALEGPRRIVFLYTDKGSVPNIPIIQLNNAIQINQNNVWGNNAGSVDVTPWLADFPALLNDPVRSLQASANARQIMASFNLITKDDICSGEMLAGLFSLRAFAKPSAALTLPNNPLTLSTGAAAAVDDGWGAGGHTVFDDNYYRDGQNDCWSWKRMYTPAMLQTQALADVAAREDIGIQIPRISSLGILFISLGLLSREGTEAEKNVPLLSNATAWAQADFVQANLLSFLACNRHDNTKTPWNWWYGGNVESVLYARPSLRSYIVWREKDMAEFLRGYFSMMSLNFFPIIQGIIWTAGIARFHENNSTPITITCSNWNVALLLDLFPNNSPSLDWALQLKDKAVFEEELANGSFIGYYVYKDYDGMFDQLQMIQPARTVPFAYSLWDGTTANILTNPRVDIKSIFWTTLPNRTMQMVVICFSSIALWMPTTKNSAFLFFDELTQSDVLRNMIKFEYGGTTLGTQGVNTMQTSDNFNKMLTMDSPWGNEDKVAKDGAKDGKTEPQKGGMYIDAKQKVAVNTNKNLNAVDATQPSMGTPAPDSNPNEVPQ